MSYYRIHTECAALCCTRDELKINYLHDATCSFKSESYVKGWLKILGIRIGTFMSNDTLS